MKYRLTFPRPRRADATILPASLVGLLAALLLLQFLVPRQLTLPEPGVVRPFALAPARPIALVADAAILAQPLFARARGGESSSVSAPVDGAIAIGVLARGRARTGFLQAPNGSVSAVSPGMIYHGWRLAAIGSGTLMFRRGTEAVTLPVAARTASAPPVGGVAPR